MSLIYRYPVDLTGRNPTNHVSGEPQLLVDYEGIDYKLIAMDHGGFYTQGLMVHDSNRNLLKPYIDYIATYTYENATFRTGIEVCGVIVFLNPNQSGLVYVSAQMVGGDYAFDTNAIANTITWLTNTPGTRPTWGGIVGEERKWLPGELTDELWDKEAYQSMNIKLEELAQVILLGNQPKFDVFRSNVRALHEQYLNGNDDSVLNHITDQDNPHSLTKNHVNLGLVENLPIASVAQATDGVDDETYMTPQRTGLTMTTFVTGPLTAHIQNQDNPHGITAAELGSYTEAEFMTALAARLDRLGTAVNARVVANPSDSGFKLLNLWERISRLRLTDQTNYGPGPGTLVGGDISAGFFGEVAMGGVNQFVGANPGTYPMQLQPGIYSVLLVGGGGGGAGNMGVPAATAAGGGSGYAQKTRITVNQGDVVTINVGRGGVLNNDGTDSSIVINGVTVASAERGKRGFYVPAGLRSQGGDGASGGGSAGGAVTYNGTTQVWSSPGVGGTNGTSGGANGAVSGGIAGGPGGAGAGAGYYDTVLNSIDPTITHGFVVGQQGRGGLIQGGGSFSVSAPGRGSAGGGGGGLGKFPAPRHTYGAEGYGAGGSTGANSTLSAGHDGLVSVLPFSVPPPNFENITGNTLADELGITQGSPLYPNDGWLKFAIDGKVLFVAKRPFRSGVSWEHLNSVNAVYGNRVTTIEGLQYSIRLMRGVNTDPVIFNANTSANAMVGSEWNRLMIPVSTTSPTAQRWASYTDAQLQTFQTTGGYSWCIESTSDSGLANAITRGYNGVGSGNSNPKPSNNPTFGWRPVLELAIQQWTFQNPITGQQYQTGSYTRASQMGNRYSDLNLIDETTHWGYDDDNGRLQYGIASESLVGVVSNEPRDTYVFETRLDARKDIPGIGDIGICIARAIAPDGRRHILTVTRGMTGDAPMRVEVNRDGFSSRDNTIAAVRSGLTWADGEVAVGPRPTTTVGWHSFTGGVLLKVSRTGDTITIQTSQYGSSDYYTPATTTFTLNDHPSLAVFKVEQPYGYVCVNIAGATWVTLDSPSDTVSYTQLVANLRSNLDASNFTSGVFPTARLGAGSASNATVLRGDGTWTSVQALLAEYNTSPTPPVLFIGSMGTDANALQHIGVTYASINTYPVGTVVLYRTQEAIFHTNGNGGGASYPLSLLRAALRQPQGWTSL